MLLVAGFLFKMLTNIQSETLRRSAETAMHTLVRTVFSKLKKLDPVEEEAKLAIETEDEAKEGELRIIVTSQDETVEEVQLEDPVEPTETVESYQELLPRRTPIPPENRLACA
jgi:brefeldin A-resistance guanine nucleotide exchange factor 1